MANNAQSDPKRWDGPIPWEPDSKSVGPAIMAWYALHGVPESGPAEAADTIAWAAGTIAAKLGAFGPGVANPLSPSQAGVAIREAEMLLGFIAEIFDRFRAPLDDEAAFAFKAELKRPRGRPALNDVVPRSLKWWSVAQEVEALIAAGARQKCAVATVAQRLKLKESVVAGWCRDRRKALKASGVGSGDSENSAN